jgi:tetratricopeptide (TPR) repeat protein
VAPAGSPEEREQYEAALALYRQVGDRLGEATCLRSLGDVALRGGDHTAAREQHEAALALYRQVGNRLGEANCLKGLGDVAPAGSPEEREQYEAALALYRQVGDRLGEAESLSRLGSVYRRLGNHAAAVECFAALVAVAPQSAQAWNDLGDARERLGNWQDAVEAYREARSIDGSSAYICNNLAGALEGLRQLDEAAELYQERIRLGPEDALNAHVGLGLIEWYRGNQAQARTHFEAVLELWDTASMRALQTPSELLENKAIALLGLGRQKGATATLREALTKLEPEDTISFGRYDLLASANPPPSGLNTLRRLLEVARRNRAD